MVMTLLTPALNIPFLQTDNRGQHCSDQRSFTGLSDPKDISPDHRQCPARLDYFGAGQKRLALGWAQQIDLELNTQNLGARRHETVGSIAGSRIRDGGHDSCM